MFKTLQFVWRVVNKHWEMFVLTFAYREVFLIYSEMKWKRPTIMFPHLVKADQCGLWLLNFFYRKEPLDSGKHHSHGIMMLLFLIVSVRKEAEHDSSMAKGSKVMLRGDMQTPTKGTEMVTPVGLGQGQECSWDFLAPSKNKTSHFLLK